MKVAVVVVLGLAALAASAPSSISSSIHQDLATKGTTNVLLTMAKSTHRQVLQNVVANREVFATQDALRTGIYSAMKSYADQSQAAVLAILSQARTANSNMRFEQLWTSNQIIVRNVDAATFAQLESHPDILEITEEKFLPLDAPIDLKVYPDAKFLPPHPQAGQWGVVEIEADKVHESGNRGEGIVVANIDTGVRYTHQALREGWVDNGYGWYDPGAGSVAPNDQNGHGTHTMGTIAGRANGIGVAPGAKWIACKGCSSSSCSSFDLMSCGQWVACPTLANGQNADCTKAPHVVSNSWGGGQGDSWYNDNINAWVAMGIPPLFSSGNSGPSCRTSNSPSDQPAAWAVGSTAQGGSVSSFSSVGPTTAGLQKPEMAAPGSSVVSAYYTSDTAYATLSGTSMACPHAAGLSALVRSAKPNITLAQLKTALTQPARPHTVTGRNCGGMDETVFPNNAVGHGIIHAVGSTSFANNL